MGFEDIKTCVYKIRAFLYRLSAGPAVFLLPLASKGWDVCKEVCSYKSERIYTVNLFEYSCTCPDFLKRRQYFSKGDVRRVCKHQYDLLKEAGLLHQADELSRAVWEFGATRRKLRRFQNKRGIEFAVSTDYGKEWIDVVARKKYRVKKTGSTPESMTCTDITNQKNVGPTVMRLQVHEQSNRLFIMNFKASTLKVAGPFCSLD